MPLINLAAPGLNLETRKQKEFQFNTRNPSLFKKLTAGIPRKRLETLSNSLSTQK
jgi:hypothetical protein